MSEVPFTLMSFFAQLTVEQRSRIEANEENLVGDECGRLGSNLQYARIMGTLCPCRGHNAPTLRGIT